MPMSSAFANDILKLIFNGTSIPGLADNAASSPLTQTYLALHTADPGVNGTQSTSEIGYTGYARVPVVRTGAGWTVTGNVASPTSTVNWPLGTGGGGTATFLSIGTNQTGNGKILIFGSLAPSIQCGNGVTPQLTPQSTVTEN